jgi:thiol-disulfide isomerase/thioredoxin
MKRALILLLMLLLCSINSFSEVKLPAGFQGTWMIEGANTGDWDAISVTDNHVEFFYDMYKIDSLAVQGGGYHLFMSSGSGKHTSVLIEKSSDSIATFNFKEWGSPRTCRLVVKHPDMVNYSPTKAETTLPGNWIIGRNPETAFTIADNKMLLEGKRYDIVWFGRYLDLEYRALLKDKDTYRLVYLRQNGRTLTIRGDEKYLAYTVKAKNDAVYEVLGNWYEPVANNWTFGFMEDFAIYDGKFWDYESLKFSGKNGNAVLKRGNKRITLKLSKLKDSVLSVQSADKVVKTYHLAGKMLPAYQTPDKSVFKDTHFQTIDTAYISGCLRNYTNNEPFSIGYHNALNGLDEKAYGDVDEHGRFLIRIPLLNTSVVYFILATGTTYDVIEPAERYMLYYDFGDGTHLAMGNNARIHNELANYKPHEAFANVGDWNETRKLSSLDFLSTKRNELLIANEFSGRYFRKLPNLSERAMYFIKNYNRSTVGVDLLQKQYDLDREKKEQFPEGYMSFVKDSLMASLPVPFTISPGVSTFVRDYVRYHQIAEPQVSISHDKVFRNMIRTGVIKTSNEEKSFMLEIADIDSIGTVDSLRGQKLRDSIGVEKTQAYGKLRFENESELEGGVIELLWQTVLNNELKSYQKNLPNADVRKSLQATAIYNYLERTRKALEPEKFAALLKGIGSPAMEESLVNYQNHLLKIPGEDFSYAESLKNTNHLKGAKDADSLLNALLLPYKGKVVYIDFWGTWCGPCREEMKYVGAAKEALKDKEVIFMYFANNSPESTWKSMIKDMKLTGSNVVHYKLPDQQQNMLEKRLSIKGFPTYMLIDKDGKLVSTAAPRPSNPVELAKAVNVLLNN